MVLFDLNLAQASKDSLFRLSNVCAVVFGKEKVVFITVKTCLFPVFRLELIKGL
ncbi:MAG: hypothetical protein ACLUDQ_06760 [Bilophila wadsworthia]|uniref:hypothetical protein n=1 Tax=Bilophila wadsworthia TaxID=35833 RepID=UPI00300EC195